VNHALLIVRGAVHYWRTHLCVAGGAAVGCAVLVGGLLVGSSVSYSLWQRALARIGRVGAALSSNDRLFRADLARELEAALPGDRLAPALQVRGVAAHPKTLRRSPNVRVLGVDARFIALAPGPFNPTLEGGEVLLSEALARELAAEEGDEILLRIEQPSMLPRDMVLSTTEEISVPVRCRVKGVLGNGQLGSFGLEASALPPMNAFFALDWLQQKLGIPGRANLLLADEGEGSNSRVAGLNDALQRSFKLEDGELFSREHGGAVELLSSRVFIDSVVCAELARSEYAATRILTYFVNRITAGERSTPYSMVCGIAGPADRSNEETRAAALAVTAVVPDDLRDDEIVVNQWLAKDLGIGPGDWVELFYFVQDSGRRLLERSASFQVRAVIPISGLAADSGLMPDFPGIADSKNCKDWEPGIPIDLKKIRDQDEKYWDDHHGTPKAFVSLASAMHLWANRFGDLTAARMQTSQAGANLQALRESLSPGSFGLFFEDVRTSALGSGQASTDFGGLFLGLSLFLEVAAFLLTALMFRLSVEQRSGEIATLLALGFRPRRILGLFLGEGALLALAAVVPGAVLGCLFTRAVIHGLSTLWKDAVGSFAIRFHFDGDVVLVGMIGSWLIAALSLFLAVRRCARREVAPALAGRELEVSAGPARSSVWRVRALLAVLSFALAALVVARADGGKGTDAAATFFIAATLVLIGLILLLDSWMHRPRRPPSSIRWESFALLNVIRRPGRSLATVVLLSTACFLVLSVSGYRLGPPRDAAERSSGTGGFSLIVESALPLLHDLRGGVGKEAYGIDAALLQGVDIVPLRVRDGDDASCLNLEQSQRPRLLGVRARSLKERGSFRFVDSFAGRDSPWRLLATEDDSAVVPAIGDEASIVWSLHKKVGDRIGYRDEQGLPFEVRIVGMLQGSILQGSLLVEESVFERLFPSEGGHRMLLVDVPADRVEAVAQELRRALLDFGATVTEARVRLMEFNTVQNTYLSIFQMLGGLGLLLGSAGLAMVLMRNVLERRAELATFVAVGFERRRVRLLVSLEHGFLLSAGVIVALLAGAVATLPLLLVDDAGRSISRILFWPGLILASGTVWLWIATRLSLRGAVLSSLRGQ